MHIYTYNIQHIKNSEDIENANSGTLERMHTDAFASVVEAQNRD
jgi:hypothetical protein